MKQIIGKTIKNIKETDSYSIPKGEEIFGFGNEDGEIEIEFEDGSKLRIWVSEYGGIDFIKGQ